MKKQLVSIAEQLAAAQAHLVAIEGEMARLEAAGMYPGVATEQMQSRNGGGAKYLYMLFRKDKDGDAYQGPGGKRKVYIGLDPDKQVEARRLNANRLRWVKLEKAARDLKRWQWNVNYDLERLNTRVRLWPRVEDLGPARRSAEEPGGPKGQTLGLAA